MLSPLRPGLSSSELRCESRQSQQRRIEKSPFRSIQHYSALFNKGPCNPEVAGLGRVHACTLGFLSCPDNCSLPEEPHGTTPVSLVSLFWLHSAHSANKWWFGLERPMGIMMMHQIDSNRLYGTLWGVPGCSTHRIAYKSQWLINCTQWRWWQWCFQDGNSCHDISRHLTTSCDILRHVTITISNLRRQVLELQPQHKIKAWIWRADVVRILNQSFESQRSIFDTFLPIIWEHLMLRLC